MVKAITMKKWSLAYSYRTYHVKQLVQSSVILIFMITSTICMGQAFIAPVDNFPTINSAIVELPNGKTINGKIRGVLLDKKGYPEAITFRDTLGNRVAYSAEQIKRISIKTNFLTKMDAFQGSTSSLAEIFGIKFNEVMEREYIVYESALLPKKKDHYRFLQLMNPGMDQNIKVYHDPNAKETKRLKAYGVALTGGKERFYLVVVNDQKAMKLKKKKYKKRFPELYGSCAKMMAIMGSNKIKFKDMPAHIYAFNLLCETQ